jgi:N-hydroxyarylamine O-acetyltransferase
MSEPATQAAPAAVDLAAYCRRIGYGGGLKPDLATLCALHEAHVGSIPFENLDVLLERPILLDTAALQEKLVRRRRGGYCFEHNNLFKDVLEAVGFPVTALAARVRFGTTGIRPRTHMTLLVEAEGRRYLCDTGFGAHGLLEPIPFLDGSVAELPILSFRLRQEDGGRWVLQATVEGPWSDLYAFTLEPQERIDYVVANHFTATAPDSIFRRSLTAQLVRRHERKLLRQGQLTITTAHRQDVRPVRNEAEARSVLEQEFGIDMPAGSVLPPHIFA